MREIKFRFWNKATNQMQRTINIDFLQGVVTWRNVWHDPSSEEDAFIDHGRLMQYTGLKDKNSMDIYEGDIVALLVDNDVRHFEVAIQTVIREVVSHPSFDGETAKVAITGVVFKWEGFELFPCIDQGTPDNLKMEVIGNIYENPELLERKE